MSISSSFFVKPIINYPRKAQVGKNYLMTIDLQSENDFDWLYEGEEYPIYCAVNSETSACECESIGEPIITLHRFGGTYGEARFLFLALQEEEIKLKVKLTNHWGISIQPIELKVSVIVQAEDLAEISQLDSETILQSLNAKNSGIDTISSSSINLNTSVESSIHPSSSASREKDERIIFTYIQDLALLDQDDAIGRFYRLLRDSNAYPNQIITSTIRKIVTDAHFEQKSSLFINCCYYTLVNRWHMRPDTGGAIRELILALEDMPLDRSQNSITQKLRAALLNYRNDECYRVLKKHLLLVDIPSEFGKVDKNVNHYFSDLFREYFFLYEAATQTPDISRSLTNLNEGILHKRNKRLRQFGQDLNRFYVRSQRTDSINTANPTHLSDADLLTAINLYRPKRSNSFKHQAELFKIQTQQVRTVGEFKILVLDHMAKPISQIGLKSQRYFDHFFQGKIADFQSNIPLTQVVRIQMFSRLIHAITNVSGQEEASLLHFVHRVGPNIVTSLLLNIVLSCEMLRFELEKQLASLYNQFYDVENRMVNSLRNQFESEDEIRSLLTESYDHLNVALAINAKYLGYFNQVHNVSREEFNGIIGHSSHNNTV